MVLNGLFAATCGICHWLQPSHERPVLKGATRPDILALQEVCPDSDRDRILNNIRGAFRSEGFEIDLI
jgi:hypothetical protein